MAVHNGMEHLSEAVDSILGQSFADFELVLVDDASTDGTRDYLRSLSDPRIVLLCNEQNLGLTRSLIRGLEVAQGSLIARMDADDVSLPGRLQAQYEALEKSDAQVCFCRCLIIDEDPGREDEWREQDWRLARWRVLFGNEFGPHPAAMFKRQPILDAGGYDANFSRAQDYDLWDRCLAKGYSFEYLSRPLLRYRSHASSITRRFNTEQSAAAAMVSNRALGRAFPGSSEQERAALRWLMTGRQSPLDEAAILVALEFCCRRGLGYACDLVWKDVSARLARRLKQLNGRARRLAMRRMFEAALRSGSLGPLARALYAVLFPRRSS